MSEAEGRRVAKALGVPPGKDLRIAVTGRTPTGRASRVRISSGGVSRELQAAEFRKAAGYAKIRSLKMEIVPVTGGWRITGEGWGHGWGCASSGRTGWRGAARDIARSSAATTPGPKFRGRRPEDRSARIRAARASRRATPASPSTRRTPDDPVPRDRGDRPPRIFGVAIPSSPRGPAGRQRYEGSPRAASRGAPDGRCRRGVSPFAPAGNRSRGGGTLGGARPALEAAEGGGGVRGRGRPAGPPCAQAGRGTLGGAPVGGEPPRREGAGARGGRAAAAVHPAKQR